MASQLTENYQKRQVGIRRSLHQVQKKIEVLQKNEGREFNCNNINNKDNKKIKNCAIQISKSDGY